MIYQSIMIVFKQPVIRALDISILSFLAHLSQRLTCELIGYPWIRRPSSASVVRPSVHIFKHLLLRNRLANQSQICVEPPWEGGTKVCINGPGHMTKMAATPIYGKNLKKSSSPEPAG